MYRKKKRSLVLATMEHQKNLTRWSLKLASGSKKSLKDHCEPSQAALALEDASVDPSIWYGAFDVILLKLTNEIFRNLLNKQIEPCHGIDEAFTCPFSSPGIDEAKLF